MMDPKLPRYRVAAQADVREPVGVTNLACQVEAFDLREELARHRSAPR